MECTEQSVSCLLWCKKDSGKPGAWKYLNEENHKGQGLQQYGEEVWLGQLQIIVAV